MPEWFDNELRCQGDEEVLSRFRQEVRGNEPAVEQMSRLRTDGGYSVFQLGRVFPGPYTDFIPFKERKKAFKWARVHYGCNPILSQVRELFIQSNLLVYRFRSSDRYPSSWLMAVAKKYPKILFTLTIENPIEGGRTIVQQGPRGGFMQSYIPQICQACGNVRIGCICSIYHNSRGTDPLPLPIAPAFIPEGRKIKLK